MTGSHLKRTVLRLYDTEQFVRHRVQTFFLEHSPYSLLSFANAVALCHQQTQRHSHEKMAAHSSRPDFKAAAAVPDPAYTCHKLNVKRLIMFEHTNYIIFNIAHNLGCLIQFCPERLLRFDQHTHMHRNLLHFSLAPIIVMTTS